MLRNAFFYITILASTSRAFCQLSTEEATRILEERQRMASTPAALAELRQENLRLKTEVKSLHVCLDRMTGDNNMLERKVQELEKTIAELKGFAPGAPFDYVSFDRRIMGMKLEDAIRELGPGKAEAVLGRPGYSGWIITSLHPTSPPDRKPFEKAMPVDLSELKQSGSAALVEKHDTYVFRYIVMVDNSGVITMYEKQRAVISAKPTTRP